MRSRLQITFRGLPPSEAIEEKIRERVEKLDSLYDRMTSCRVHVESPHAHHHKGKLYEVHIDVSVPHHEIVVSRSGNINHAREDVYVAIRDAFDAATRQLDDHLRRQRGEVKVHDRRPDLRIVPASED